MITFGECQAVRKGHPVQYVVGIVNKKDGITAKFGGSKDAHVYSKKPNLLIKFLNLWVERNYSGLKKKFAAKLKNGGTVHSR